MLLNTCCKVSLHHICSYKTNKNRPNVANAFKRSKSKKNIHLLSSASIPVVESVFFHSSKTSLVFILCNSLIHSANKRTCYVGMSRVLLDLLQINDQDCKCKHKSYGHARLSYRSTKLSYFTGIQLKQRKQIFEINVT